MPDKDSRIEEIKQALEAATPGPWQHSPGDSIDEPAAVYVIEEDGIQTFTVADNLLGVDAHLIANAPEWLRWQQAEIERLKESLEYEEHRFATLRDSTYIRGLQTDLQQSREENERLQQKLKDYEGCKGIEEFYTVLCKFRDCQSERDRLQGELEQVKAERDDYRRGLEWYADNDSYTVPHLGCSAKVMADRGKLANSILSRYEKGESQ